jgi:hypothetical protein
MTEEAHRFGAWRYVPPWYDLLIVDAYGLLALSGFLPWLLVLERPLRPADLPLGWLAAVAFAGLALLVLAEGAVAFVRWLRPLPFGLGCLLIGLAVGLAAATVGLNATISSLIGTETSRLASSLEAWMRVPGLGTAVERVQTLLVELPGRLRVDLQAGFWLFSLGTLVLIGAGYRKLMPGQPRADRGSSDGPVANPG